MKLFFSAVLFALTITNLAPAQAAGRYTYDVQKFETILKSVDVENALRLTTLDGISMKSADDTQKLITYELKTNNASCLLEVVLSWSEGMSPNYQVKSVGAIQCP